MTKISSAFLVATSALMIAGPASAQSYPRVTGTGENMMVDYGPMGQGALVGGGRVMISGTGMNIEIMHFDSVFSQSPRPGYVPMTIGSGSSEETVWVPETMIEMIRRARAARAAR